jgi:NADH dehydrogenase FAD-containing subunit
MDALSPRDRTDVPADHTSAQPGQHYTVLIVGGGAAGITVAVNQRSIGTQDQRANGTHT